MTRKSRKAGRVAKSANPEYVEAMQLLRRSNAARPHRNRKRYYRPDVKRRAASDSE